MGQTSPDAARNSVLAALRDPAIARMGFGVGWILIFPHDYERVAKAIESGAISVQVNSDVLAGHGKYDYQANCFYLPQGGSDLDVLIHESTHAIFDIRKLATSTAESEGMAYIAQSLFYRIKFGPQSRYIPSMNQDPISWFGWQTIYDESLALAEILIKTPYITPDRAQGLFNAIGMTKDYIDQGQYAKYDGVPGA